jgi:methionyl-tRNA synthetase
LKWGITLPFDDQYVTYVWFDALLNYISAPGYPDGEAYRTFWPVVQHIVAKDILKPHGIYWPIMLKAAGIPVYQHLNVHGYWNVDESKMSKSLGNVADPLDLKNVYGLDAFRYFLVREMAFGLDANFSETALVGRINADLANDLGNLFSRVTAMTHKYFKGVVPECDPEIDKEVNLGLVTDAEKAVRIFEEEMTGFAFHKAYNAVWELIGQMNKYIDMSAPWELAKKKSSRKQLEAVIYKFLEGLRILSGLIYPVMPETAASMQRHLGFDIPENLDGPLFDLADLKTWGGLPFGTQLPKSTALFPRIETTAKPPAEESPPVDPDIPDIKPEIGFDAFQAIDLRVATVVKAEAIPQAKKLLKLEVDLGQRRTIVAGIAQHYAPEELVGKQVIVAANLKPAKIMGTLSNGMLLAAVDRKKTTIATVEGEVKPGTPLR